MDSLRFRRFALEDAAACLGIFDLNAPEFFALNERDDYRSFLEEVPSGYEVCLLDGHVVGAFGLIPAAAPDRAHLRWILIDPRVQGGGIGSTLMSRVLEAARARGCRRIQIAASHRSEGFFARFGAVARVRTEHGWGPGMHRVDMELGIDD